MDWSGLLLCICALAACGCAAGALSEVDRGGLLWKAANYERAMQARHLRDGGMVLGGARFPTPLGHEGEDDENSAYLTGAYLASLSFRYAVTGEAEARDQARRCAASLRKLVDVTGCPGYLARWWRPVAEAKPKEVGWLAKAWRTRGKYRWLGNPSTDQYTGVMFGYSVYYDLAADARERRLVGKYVGEMIGRVVEAGMKILDPEGKPTTWYDMSPESLQEPLYSIVALHLLKVAYQTTGQQRFEDKYRELALQRHYLQRAIKQKADEHWNRSDDVMSFESFYTTLQHEQDPALREGLARALQANWENVRADGRHLFGICYDALCPGAGQSAAAIQELVDFPSQKLWVTGREHSGQPVPSWQRVPGWFDFMSDPHQRAVGMEESGVDYLLAYWMARYHGLIK